MPRCAAVKKDGKKCTCKANQGSLYCFRHIAEGETDVTVETFADVDESLIPIVDEVTVETFADVDESLMDSLVEGVVEPIAVVDDPEIEIINVTLAKPEFIIANLLDKIKMLDIRIDTLEGKLASAQVNKPKVKKSHASNKWAKLIYYHKMKETPLIQAYFGESKAPWNKVKKQTNRMFELLSDEEKDAYRSKGQAKYATSK